ncbi:HPr family phosphocarrier protein [Haloarcula amylovorans]|uniref:HPr family phosphocarrier protein n=1 Tax=Haloarcula amylovorans TaxID=2562280 RepID=UPI001076B035
MDRTVEIVPEAGLHARPASKLVQTANAYDATVQIGHAGADDEELVAANSMLAVTGLNAQQGDEVVLVAEGDDAEAALDALEAVLTTPVEEEDGSTEGAEDHETETEDAEGGP